MIENELYMPWIKITEHFTYTLESACNIDYSCYYFNYRF